MVSDKINHAPPWQPTQASRVQAGCCKMCENFWHYHSCTVPAGCSPTPKSVKLELPDNSKPSEEVGEQPIGTVQLGLAGRRSRLPKALPGLLCQDKFCQMALRGAGLADRRDAGLADRRDAGLAALPYWLAICPIGWRRGRVNWLAKACTEITQQ